jgi:hypothetical protein
VKLFIFLDGGRPSGHPILESNFREAFPAIDLANLPSNVAVFERVGRPALGEYQKLSHSYDVVDGVVKDVWRVEAMTAEERAAVDSESA